MDKSTEYLVLYRNIPGNDLWEGSFYEKLVEYGIWDENEFWKMHLDLIRIAKNSNGQMIDRDLSMAIVKIYVRVSSLIAAHFDAADIFVIRNLSHDQILGYGERLNLAVVGAFSSEVLDESYFDLQSPFLKND